MQIIQLYICMCNFCFAITAITCITSDMTSTVNCTTEKVGSFRTLTQPDVIEVFFYTLSNRSVRFTHSHLILIMCFVFSFQPVLHDWCNKGRGMFYPVCGMMHIKEPLLLIRKSSPCSGSGFPISLSEWSFTICLRRRITVNKMC